MAAPIKAVGPKSDKEWRSAIRKAVHDVKKRGDTKPLHQLAAKLVEEALDGNVVAMKEIGDRLDGKPVQGVEVAGDQDNPLQTITRVIIDSAEHQDS